jgi:hypothetical protein
MEGGALVESSPGNGGASSRRVHEAWVRANEALLRSSHRVGGSGGLGDLRGTRGVRSGASAPCAPGRNVPSSPP